MADAAVAAGGAARAAPIPGPAPDEIVVPVLDSIGVRLLMKMGWRHGRAVGPAHVSTGDKARRVARRAMLALARAGASDGGGGAAAEATEAGGREGGDRGEEEEVEEEEELPPAPRSTPAYVLQPKTDFHGLGFDPFRAAPEFRAAKRAKAGGSGGGGGRGGRGKVRMGGGFGIGALEEVGVEDEDVYDAQDVPDFEIGGSDDEDEEKEGRRTAASSGRRRTEEVGGAAASASCALPGFRIAAATAANDIELFPPPVVPQSFVPVHTFAEPLRPATAAPPPPAAAPASPSLLAAVQGMAAFIARGGRAAEDLARERHAGDPLFAFLSGGEGADYYRRRVWEVQQAVAAAASNSSSSLAQPLDYFGGQGEGQGRRHRLDAQGRGEMLGERPLKHEPAAPVAPSVVPAEDIARVQAQLASQFTRGRTQDMDATAACVPYAGDPAKQARYEAFVAEREKGSLSQRQDGSGASGEAAEFERTWRMLRGPGATETPMAATRAADGTSSELSIMLGSRFASASVEVSAPLPTGLVTAAQAQALLTAPTASGIDDSSTSKSHPWREEVAWRPASLLCRRFGIPDPYAGKAPPLAKPRSRTESFTLGSGAAAVESPPLLGALALPAPPSSPPAHVVEELQRTKDSDEAAPQPVEPLPEKPIDLYKAIFSDEESDIDEAEGGLAAVLSAAATDAGPAGPEESEAAVASAMAGAALNRLVAGDFLESLGKELGLDVPTPEAAAATGPAAQQLAASQARRDKGRRRAVEPTVRDLAEGKAAAFFKPAAAGPGAAGPATVDGRGGAALAQQSREAATGEPQEKHSSGGLLGLVQVSGGGRDTEKAVGTGAGKSAPSGSRSGSGSSSSSSLLDSSEVEREQRRRRRQERKSHKERKERRHGKRRLRSGSKKSAKFAMEEGSSSKKGRGHKEERHHKRHRRRSHKEVLVGAA
eukprot:SM000047S16850  [mRNA]  locus=s47:374710:379559:+ [translate_table: standard]